MVKWMLFVVLVVAAFVKTTKSQGLLPSWCRGPVDLALVVDASTSIDEADWQNTTRFVDSLVSELTIGPNDVRLAFIRFASHAEVMFNLQASFRDDKQRIRNSITGIRYTGGGTNLRDALHRVYGDVLRNGNGVRGGTTKKVALILTDGGENERDTIRHARECERQGIRLIAAGIHRHFNRTRLQEIISNNSDVHHISDYTNNQAMKAALLRKIVCPTKLCHKPVDVAFVVDASGSVPDSDWGEALRFTTSLVDRLALLKESNVAQVGFVHYSTNAEILFGLTALSSINLQNVKAKILGVSQTKGFTDLNEALTKTCFQVFGSNGGARPGVQKVAMILTDGDDNVPRLGNSETLDTARRCRNAGVRIIAVGINHHLNKSRLEQIVSSPSDIHENIVSDFGLLNTLLNKITEEITCPNKTRPMTAVSGCPNGFVHYSTVNGCYKIIDFQFQWKHAAEYCRAVNDDAHLVVVNSSAEQQVLQQLLSTHRGTNMVYWTAGRRVDPLNQQVFFWVTTDPSTSKGGLAVWTYNNWQATRRQPSQPTGTDVCVGMWKSSGAAWFDSSCSTLAYPVCEVDM